MQQSSGKKVRNERKGPGYVGHRKHFRFYSKDDEKPLEGSEQGDAIIYF